MSRANPAVVRIDELDTTDDDYLCTSLKHLEDASTLYKWGKKVWDEVTSP